MEIPDTIEEFLDTVSQKLRFFMLKEDAVVSGSTALFYYMKKHNLSPQFEPSDVDIFTTVNRETILDLKLFSKKQLNKATRGKYNHIKTIREVLSYEIPHYNMKLDIVLISNDFKGKSVDFINETFDLDFCKCWYDGREIYGNYELIKSRKCVLTKTNIDLTHALPTEKILRYFSDIRKTSDNAFDPYHHIARVKKYRERGFEIDTSQLEIPQELVERYIQFSITLLNMHRLSPVDVVICYDKNLLLKSD